MRHVAWVWLDLTKHPLGALDLPQLRQTGKDYKKRNKKSSQKI